MELYTSLTRLKQAINGVAPPMTPVPVTAQDIIDPTFTIGLGGLEEDAERGLRCPVRECGRFFHNLGKHLSKSHADIGGIRAVRRALSIPSTAGLVSVKCRDQMRAAAERAVRRESPERRVSRIGQRRSSNKPDYGESVNYRNLRDRCEAQMAEKLRVLSVKLGRSPSINDTIAAYGEGLVAAVKRVYGTWDNAKSQFGLAHSRGGRPLVRADDVLRGIRAFYDATGRFPTALEADSPVRAPLVCSSRTIMRALQADTWAKAMHRAAAELSIYQDVGRISAA